MVDPGVISKWSVLVVDDEPDNLEVVAESLEFLGLSIKTAQSGSEGLEILQDYLPDLILLDLSMPTMSGWEMRAKVKSDANTAHIPIVALSAHAMVGDKERALNAGFDGYMTKPINVITLLQDISIALSSAKPIALKPPKAEPNRVSTLVPTQTLEFHHASKSEGTKT
jgi:two-component system, cell cycle response regulator DivK